MDYELPKNGVVDLVSGMTLFFRTPKAKLLTLDVKSFDTVQDVKRKIQNLESIPVAFQLLNYNQQPLTDGTKTLSGYKIKLYHIVKLAQKGACPRSGPRSSGKSESTLILRT